MTQIAYPQAETEPATDNRSHTENHLVQADQIESCHEDQAEVLHKEQIEALRDENGVITKGHTKVRLKSDLTQRYMGDIIRDVDAYVLVDYSTQWQQSDNLKLTFGIKNLFDEQPPLSLRTSGGGHQVGYDPRYVQELGRTFYLKLAYSL